MVFRTSSSEEGMPFMERYFIIVTIKQASMPSRVVLFDRTRFDSFSFRISSADCICTPFLILNLNGKILLQSPHTLPQSPQTGHLPGQRRNYLTPPPGSPAIPPNSHQETQSLSIYPAPLVPNSWTYAYILDIDS